MAGDTDVAATRAAESDRSGPTAAIDAAGIDTAGIDTAAIDAAGIDTAAFGAPSERPTATRFAGQ